MSKTMAAKEKLACTGVMVAVLVAPVCGKAPSAKPTSRSETAIRPTKENSEAARLYEKGVMSLQRGGPDGLRQAALSLSRAAQLGDCRAQAKLGQMHEEGVAAEDSREKAIFWYTKAAAQGYARAAYNLSGLYYGENDTAMGLKWLRKAAELGYPRGQARLGRLYMKGRTVPLNYDEAARWLKEAAKNGDIKGQYYLANLYEHGRGVQQNMHEAMRIYLSLANKGEIDAQDRLAEIYGRGLGGVPKDSLQATFWRKKAQRRRFAEHSLDMQILEDMK